ncbi:MAG: hypothetical protein K2X39_07900 [Silvanigrellaceae bacterium]|nr:hypothetical protein [Silvanigrellaceae bacterium]
MSDFKSNAFRLLSKNSPIILFFILLFFIHSCNNLSKIEFNEQTNLKQQKETASFLIRNKDYEDLTYLNELMKRYNPETFSQFTHPQFFDFEKILKVIHPKLSKEFLLDIIYYDNKKYYTLKTKIDEKTILEIEQRISIFKNESMYALFNKNFWRTLFNKQDDFVFHFIDFFNQKDNKKFIGHFNKKPSNSYKPIISLTFRAHFITFYHEYRHLLQYEKKYFSLSRSGLKDREHIKPFIFFFDEADSILSCIEEYKNTLFKLDELIPFSSDYIKNESYDDRFPVEQSYSELEFYYYDAANLLNYTKIALDTCKNHLIFGQDFCHHVEDFYFKIDKSVKEIKKNIFLLKTISQENALLHKKYYNDPLEIFLRQAETNLHKAKIFKHIFLDEYLAFIEQAPTGVMLLIDKLSQADKNELCLLSGGFRLLSQSCL